MSWNYKARTVTLNRYTEQKLLELVNIHTDKAEKLLRPGQELKRETVVNSLVLLGIEAAMR